MVIWNVKSFRYKYWKDEEHIKEEKVLETDIYGDCKDQIKAQHWFSYTMFYNSKTNFISPDVSSGKHQYMTSKKVCQA